MSDNGQRRRASDNSTNIHDLVIRIDENVKTLKESFVLHKEDLIAHKQDDDDKFESFGKRLIPLEQAYWRMVGIIALLVILLKFIPSPWK